MSDEVEVTVTVPEAEPVETPEAAPVVVVVEDVPEPQETAPVEINHEQRLTRLEENQNRILELLEQQAMQTANAAITADVALEVADHAVDVAEEVAEGEQPSPESDPAPKNEHWFFA